MLCAGAETTKQSAVALKGLKGMPGLVELVDPHPEIVMEFKAQEKADQYVAQTPVELMPSVMPVLKGRAGLDPSAHVRRVTAAMRLWRVGAENV